MKTENSRRLEPKLNVIFITMVVFFLLLILLRYIVPETLFIFVSPIGESLIPQSIYGLLVIWSFSTLGLLFLAISVIKEKRFAIELIIHKVGFVSKTPMTDIFLGIVTGCVIGISVLYFNAIYRGSELSLVSLSILELFGKVPLEILNILIGAPILEELVFRRLMISKIQYFFKGKFGIIASLISSTMLFSYIHPLLPELKISYGLIYGSLYILRKNLYPSVFAHAFSNLTMIIIIIQ
ncbi:MAG: CPBP family intramembrane glutamic endopeptidase [Thermoproteota archaeon]